MTDFPDRSPRSGLPVLEDARERTVAALSAHFAADRLDVAELERRLDLVYTADSPARLDELLADLPALPEPTPAAGKEPAVHAVPVEPGRTVPRNQTVVAIMAATERKGQWTPPRHLNVFALMGAAGVDFREARFGEPVTEVTVAAFMGGIEIIVPPGVRVESNGLAIMGAFEQVTQDTAGPDAPLIKVNGFACMGSAEIVVRLPGESEKDARRRLKREAKERKKLARGSNC